MAATPERILVTGAGGQIGSELVPHLRRRHGADVVVATDVRETARDALGPGPFEVLDVRDRGRLREVVDRHQIGVVFHMAAILSAMGEAHPQLAWDVNVGGLVNVLEVARERELRRVFCPSSIAVFGPETPRELAPQSGVLRPSTMYGLSKVTGELLADYYAQRYGLDVRGLRYPGIISSEAPPGGGTTDFAVDMFVEALRTERYTCFVRPDTVLPMMYMPDCIRATIQIMDAPPDSLSRRADYNLASMSFSAAELAAEIQKSVPSFCCTYEPDFRQAIADSWPREVDDSAARADWGWSPSYSLPTMAEDMLRRLADRRRGIHPSP
ncbi:MAG: NAD-dependent epimerase/dehydratase family protein [Candidatus Bipolaricaulota bacterium]